jgi:hypothetical protein
MLGYIIKFLFLVIVIMIALNIFAPKQAEKIVTYFSEKTEIEEKTLKESLDKATKFTQDTVSEVSNKVKKSIEE